MEETRLGKERSPRGHLLRPEEEGLEGEALLLSQQRGDSKQVDIQQPIYPSSKQNLDHSDMSGLEGHAWSEWQREREGGGGIGLTALDGDEQSMSHRNILGVGAIEGNSSKRTLKTRRKPPLSCFIIPGHATKFLSHDWKSDPHSRSGMFALRVYSSQDSDACADSVQPWKHTENMTITQ